MLYVFYTLGFLVELIAWGAVASLGFLLTQNKVLGWVLTVILFVATIVLWGLFMSPKADYKLPLVAYYGVKLLLYGVAAAVLWRHSPYWAVGFVVAVIVSEPFLYEYAVEVRK